MSTRTHLRHPDAHTTEAELDQLRLWYPSNRAEWLRMAKLRPLCWGNGAKLTDDPTLVTCKICKLKMELLRDRP